MVDYTPIEYISSRASPNNNPIIRTPTTILDINVGSVITGEFMIRVVVASSILDGRTGRWLWLYWRGGIDTTIFRFVMLLVVVVVVGGGGNNGGVIGSILLGEC